MMLRNGVDTSAFHPVDRDQARAALGLTGPTLVSVGSLIPRKGHHRTIEAMLALPEFTLLIVGVGPERAALEALIGRLGLNARVRLLGARPHAELPKVYGAADASVLASSREGWANVLLELIACGTPVVASNIPGNPEVVQEWPAGPGDRAEYAGRDRGGRAPAVCQFTRAGRDARVCRAVQLG